MAITEMTLSIEILVPLVLVFLMLLISIICLVIANSKKRHSISALKEEYLAKDHKLNHEVQQSQMLNVQLSQQQELYQAEQLKVCLLYTSPSPRDA